MTDDKKYRSLLLFGPPGVGKGTQGSILGTIPGFFHLSVGDVFRALDIGSEEGREVYQYSSQGKLVPDELTIRIWKKTLSAYVALSWFKPWEDLLVLDGIPRNAEQAELVRDHLYIEQIVHLRCGNQEDMIHRIKRRAIRENRADDAQEDVIRHRFEVYNTVSSEVLSQYPEAIQSNIEASGSPAEVLSRILESVIPIQNRVFQTEW